MFLVVTAAQVSNVAYGPFVLYSAVFHIYLTFLQVVSSAIVDKYIGESARLIREMFAFARDHEPCIIFMDEIDAIGK